MNYSAVVGRTDTVEVSIVWTIMYVLQANIVFITYIAFPSGKKQTLH